VGSRGEDPIGGLVDEPLPQADTYLGNGCKTDILRRKKIENAYTSRCFLKRAHAAVLSIHDNRISRHT